MKLPPWKLAEREEWAEARPWLAGLYFGLLMSLVYAVYLMIIGGTDQLYLAALGDSLPGRSSPSALGADGGNDQTPKTIRPPPIGGDGAERQTPCSLGSCGWESLLSSSPRTSS